MTTTSEIKRRTAGTASQRTRGAVMSRGALDNEGTEAGGIKASSLRETDAMWDEPGVTLAEALAEITPVSDWETLRRMQGKAVQPAKWFPAAPVEQRANSLEAHPVRELIQMTALLMVTVVPVMQTPEAAEIEQLRAKLATAEADLAKAQSRMARRVRLDDAAGACCNGAVDATDAPPIPMLSASMSGHYRLGYPKRSRWQRFTTALSRWMGGWS